MKSKELRPIRQRPEYFEAIEELLRSIFRKEIYVPLILEAEGSKSDLVTNSMDDLTKAIAEGRIWHKQGNFMGRFDAATSRELKKLGATWDRKKKSWKLPASELPADVKIALATSETRFASTVKKIDAKLEDLYAQAGAEQSPKLEELLDKTIYRVNKDVEDSLEGIKVGPQLSASARKRIAEEYSETIHLNIQGWMRKEVLRLRKEIQEHAFNGGRYQELTKRIRDSYGASEKQAKFVARQETSLLMTKFKQVRYQDAGVNEYRWSCVNGSPAHPVRPMHKKNDGKIFTWDNPPIVDEQGNRKNPGQDYNCRCAAIPVVRF